MSLHLCLDCATIYDIPSGVKPICPKCDKLLGLAQKEMDKTAVTFVELCSRAIHGPTPSYRRVWRIG